MPEVERRHQGQCARGLPVVVVVAGSARSSSSGGGGGGGSSSSSLFSIFERERERER